MSKVKISDVAFINRKTFDYKNVSFINYLDTGSITNNKIEQFQKINKNESVPSRAKRAVSNETIVYSSVRPRLCHFGFLENIPENCVVSTGFITLDSKPNINPFYLFNCLITPEKIEYIAKIADTSVSSYPSINPEDLGNMEIEINDNYEEQCKIAHLLRNINDKINTNLKINDNLQQLCELIFLQSFANKKSNGIIGDILQENPKSKIQVGQTEGIKGKYPFFTSGESITEWDEHFIDGANLFLSTGGNASINIFNGKGAYSTDTWCIKGKNNSSIYLYLFIKNILNKINDWHFAGSGLRHLQKDTFTQIPLYIPNDYELNHFNKIAENCYRMISDNYLENKRLESVRDFLLPLLMNGQATIE